MRCRESGLALVTVLFLLTMLMVLGLMFAEKVLRGTRDATLAAAHEQGLQAAGAGVEWIRHQLAATYRDSQGWARYLAAAPGGERYPASPAFALAVGRMTVEIYLRDNPDGDGNPRRDSDLQLFVLARARPTHGGEVLVESLCRFEPAPAGYFQEGGDGRRSGQTAAAGLADSRSAQSTRFRVTE